MVFSRGTGQDYGLDLDDVEEYLDKPFELTDKQLTKLYSTPRSLK